MLTRLKVSGFKNLVDVDIYFGPFTCVAGANGTGKSNLFDAIQFLSHLADDTLINAAMSVRDEEGKTANVSSLFHRIGSKYAPEMTFEAEMIISAGGVDDLGQKAEATITFLHYTLVLAYRVDDSLFSLGSLELIREELKKINLGEAHKRLNFPHQANTWRSSVLDGRRGDAPFISTEDNAEGHRIVRLHQDGRSGRPKSLLARDLPRTVLSTVNAIEAPTALLARREMQSWRLLQLEPSALREPDKFTTPPGLGADGSHLAATLYSLARLNNGQNQAQIYDQVAARLSELISDVSQVSIDRDERRELLTLEITDHEGTVHPARALSDGTLRFLALSVLELDPQASGLICLEEPENGIHPERIPAMLSLLQDIATDVKMETGPDNPLRQVIINTHSPAVVQQVPADSLLVAELKEKIKAGQRFKSAHFSWLPDTWRAKSNPEIRPVAMGELLAYLDLPPRPQPGHKPRRVIDRPDVIQQLSLFPLREYEAE